MSWYHSSIFYPHAPYPLLIQQLTVRSQQLRRSDKPISISEHKEQFHVNDTITLDGKVGKIMSISDNKIARVLSSILPFVYEQLVTIKFENGDEHKITINRLRHEKSKSLQRLNLSTVLFSEYSQLWKSQLLDHATSLSSTAMVSLCEYRDRRLIYVNDAFDYYKTLCRLYYDLYIGLANTIFAQFLKIRQEYADIQLQKFRSSILLQQKELSETIKRYSNIVTISNCMICYGSKKKKSYCQTCFNVFCNKCMAKLTCCPYCRATHKPK